MTKMHLLNIAGRQRMLTQEYMKLFLVKRFKSYENLDALVSLEKRMNSVQSDFEAALLVLERVKGISKDLSKSLSRVNDKWQAFILSTEWSEIEAIFQKNDEVLNEMEKAVTLYERQDHRANPSLWKPML